MPKKIIDIFPPKSTSQTFTKVRPKTAKQKRSIWLNLLIVLFLILVISFSSLHFFWLQAKIQIWPKTEPFSFGEKAAIDDQAEKPDAASKVVPGRISEIEKTLSEEFSVTGSALKKSEGTIRLYNSFNTKDEIWRAGTRFVSSEGKLFFSKSRITVPGATLKNGRITASSVDVPVIAAEEGQEYNIGPSNFSIAAFLGTAKYTKYYGESFQAMTGGGTVAKVSKEDLQRAENTLIEKAKKEAESGSRGETKVGKTDILEKRSSAKEGDETEKFEFMVKTKLTIISFELKDIEEFAALSITSLLPEEKNLHRQSMTVDYQAEASEKEQSKFLIALSVSAKIYPSLDLDSLKKGLVGKPLDEAKMLLANKEELSRAEIRIFPFWLNSLPKNPAKIEVLLRIE
jgi:hypothetical protein